MNLQCVIFDCDGTLVDSEYLCNLALEKMLAWLGIKEDANSLMHKYRGWKLDTILKTLSEEHQISFSSSFVPAYRELVAEYFDLKLEPVANMREALEAIPLAKCVASSGPLHKIKHALDCAALTDYFGDKLFSAYQINSWKPKPDLFLHAANKMNVLPEHCAVVEDSLVGIEAAKRAGMKAFLYDPHNALSPSLNSVTVFTDMLELPSLLLPSKI